MSITPETADPIFVPVATPETEILGRIDRLRSAMASAGIDYALIMQTSDLFYFTGSAQKAVLVVPSDGDVLYFVQRAVSRARRESPLPVIEIVSDKAIGRDRNLFSGVGAMELDVVPVATYERMKSITGVAQFVDISGIIKSLRIVKSAHEIAQLQGSAAICDHLFEKAKSLIKVGAREIDIDGDLLAEGRKLSHQGILRMRGFNQEMMNLYVASGYTGTIASFADVPVAGLGLSPAMPHGSSTKAVEKGVPVIVDCGGGFNGYITDETRTYVIGDLEEMYKKPFEVSKDIVEDIATFGRQGVDCTEIFERAMAKVKRARLEDHFMGHGEGQVSFLGHGLGLEINELPVFTARHHTILKEGMVFAVEPKFAFHGKGVVGIEVDFVVKKDRLERLSATAIDLIRL
jgi:Xaa-Pro dipeptidase